MNYTEIIADRLKSLIDTNGFQYLEDHAYEIYEQLREEKLLNGIYARVLLICLLSADYKNYKRGELKKTSLSASIQKNCGLRKDISDQMADVFVKLFGEENYAEWEEKYHSGFKKFCEEEWTFTWEGFSVWYVQNVQVDCKAKAWATVRITDPSKVELDNEKILEKNPFIASEHIFEIYNKLLLKKLDSDFDYYCNCDDYYPPVAEDYYGNYEELVEMFCEKYGMELIDCNYDGETSDYY